ncbi:glutathione S-transferase family protein [Amorphus orientalis]|uniref:Glutathione S-transferase n=1 Tax=Amorphus orientalis TaxID=649198 RepID=A0AAE3VRW7_9HYPH|nr:glutathione S-transferase family protein [Amorphus orientalis]MDQ0317011.1 glutathione S-transferase [Amorphus orientalis]
MSDIVLTTFDWVPPLPRGFVRDLRIRWALEEAGREYRVASVPFRDRADAHFAHQPFGQVPWLTDGDVSIFESGAILLHVASQSKTLMPESPQARSEIVQWLFAALNSVEMAALPFAIFKFSDDEEQTPGRKALDGFLSARLGHMEAVLANRVWLGSGFSVADIAMSDVLRLVDRFDGLIDYPACRAYVARATDRPAFARAYADQMAHFAAAD